MARPSNGRRLPSPDRSSRATRSLPTKSTRIPSSIMPRSPHPAAQSPPRPTTAPQTNSSPRVLLVPPVHGPTAAHPIQAVCTKKLNIPSYFPPPLPLPPLPPHQRRRCAPITKPVRSVPFPPTHGAFGAQPRRLSPPGTPDWQMTTALPSNRAQAFPTPGAHPPCTQPVLPAFGFPSPTPR